MRQIQFLAIRLTTITLALLVALLTAAPAMAEEPPLEVPNIFTPNGDGVNDQLILESTQAMTLQVFNRAGNLVYKITAKRIAWDGLDTRGHAVADGLYYYTLQDPAKTYATDHGFFYIARTQVTPPKAK